MGEKNTMTDVYFFEKESQLPNALDQMDLSQFQHQEVLVKLHMGEPKNKFHIRPSFVHLVITELHKNKMNPFLYDTTVVYESPRKYVEGYQNVARKHGFSKDHIGCPVTIDDQGIQLTLDKHTFEVGTTLHGASHIVALSHVKGHVATGMGGAIKNFGMGGVTRKTKRMMHHSAKPIYTKNSCNYCGICAEVCPFDAITVHDTNWNISKSCFGCGVCVDNCSEQALSVRTAELPYLLALATKTCVTGKQVLYINDVNRISRSCDCDPNAGPVLCADVGYLLSTDPVAIDAASLDLINEQCPDVFLKENHVDPSKQIRYAEEIGLGSTGYRLIRL